MEIKNDFALALIIGGAVSILRVHEFGSGFMFYIIGYSLCILVILWGSKLLKNKSGDTYRRN